MGVSWGGTDAGDVAGPNVGVDVADMARRRLGGIYAFELCGNGATEILPLGGDVDVETKVGFAMKTEGGALGGESDDEGASLDDGVDRGAAGEEAGDSRSNGGGSL